MGDGPQKRIHDALHVVEEFGQPDGAHHLRWVIDQMVRALTGGGRDGRTTTEYQCWVSEYQEGEDGPDTYEWDEGVAP